MSRGIKDYKTPTNTTTEVKDYGKELLETCRRANLSAEQTEIYLANKYNDAMETVKILLEQSIIRGVRRDWK